MLKLFVLLGTLSVSSAIVCSQFFCKGATFDATQCKGGIIKNGGFCKCTDACAKVEGEHCQAGTGLFGFIPAGQCDQGLHCVAASNTIVGRGTCNKMINKRTLVDSLTKCVMDRIKASYSEEVIKGEWIPRCDRDGLFYTKQCDNTGACFCVDKTTGNILTPKDQGHVNC